MKKTLIYSFLSICALSQPTLSKDVILTSPQVQVTSDEAVQVENTVSTPPRSDNSPTVQPSNDTSYLDGRGYSHFDFGKANSPYDNFKAPSIALLGLGKKFGMVGMQMDYFLFEHIYLGNDTSTYIKLHGGKVSLQGYLDLGWPELNIGVSRIYYDAKSYLNNRAYSKDSHTTYGANAGLLLPIAREFDVRIDAQIMQDVLEQDFEFYTLGFNFYF